MANRFETRIVRATPAEDRAEHDRGYQAGYAQGEKDAKAGDFPRTDFSNATHYDEGFKSGYSEGYAWTLYLK